MHSFPSHDLSATAEAKPFWSWLCSWNRIRRREKLPVCYP